MAFSAPQQGGQTSVLHHFHLPSSSTSPDPTPNPNLKTNCPAFLTVAGSLSGHLPFQISPYLAPNANPKPNWAAVRNMAESFSRHLIALDLPISSPKPKPEAQLGCVPHHPRIPLFHTPSDLTPNSKQLPKPTPKSETHFPESNRPYKPPLHLGLAKTTP